MNRAQRRQAEKIARRRPPKPQRVLLLHQHSNQSAPQPPRIDGGDLSAEGDRFEEAPDMAAEIGMVGPEPDSAPRDRRHASAGARAPRALSKTARIEQAIGTFYGTGGLLVGMRNEYAGQVIVAQSPAVAHGWVETAKAEMAAGRPGLMRGLELVTISGPYLALAMPHVVMLIGFMLSVGAMPPHAAQVFGLPVPPPQAPRAAQAPADEGPTAPQGEPIYEPPAGPVGTPLGSMPDEGLPHEVERAVRAMAVQTGRPYEELRQEALVQLAQLQMAANGHQGMPAALGAPPIG